MAWDETTGIESVDQQLMRSGVPPQILKMLGIDVPGAAPPPAGSPPIAAKPVSMATPQSAVSQPPAASPAPVSLANNPQPAAPASAPANKPAAPAQPISLAKRYEEEKAPNPKDYRLKPGEGPQGAKKWLDIAGQLLSPRIESMIPGSRGNLQVQKSREFADAQAAHTQRQGEIKTEASIADTESQTRERDALAAKAANPQKAERTNPPATDVYYSLIDQGVKPEEALKRAVAADAKPSVDKLDKKIDEYTNEQSRRMEVMQRPDGTTYEVQRGTVRAEGGVPGSGKDDPQQIAAAIMRGEQPPDTRGLYRNTAAVRAELARKGFNLAKAEEDWQATQKYLATLNGAQQTRLRQAVGFTKESLDQVEDIYNEWQRVGPAGGWKVWNKASLETSKQLPGAAGELAHRLEARVADLTSELGTVYKGGNSSTDESLKLAAKNLSGDWNEQTFKNALGDIRKSIQIRENSMKNLQPAGVSSGNAYIPPSTDSDLGPAPAGKAEGSTGVLPDGTKIVVKGGRIVRQ